jgi:DNA-directed RNA polymerase subunit M/transcription elongation factor TFIIS
MSTICLTKTKEEEEEKERVSMMLSWIPSDSERKQVEKEVDLLCEGEEEWKKYLYYELSCEMHFCHLPNVVCDMVRQHSVIWDHPNFENIQQHFKEQDDFIQKPPEIEEGVLECRRCKSKRTFSFSKQTRRSDEGSTVFARCFDCQYTYKMN